MKVFSLSYIKAIRLFIQNSLSVLLLCISLSSVAYADQNILSPHRYGKIQFGSKLSEAEAAVREQALPPLKDRDENCNYVHFKKYPGIIFLVEDNVVARADVRSRKIQNSAKVTLGMSLNEVKKRHPHIQVEPHKYDESGHYLTLTTSDDRAALVFEESKGKVIKIYGGIKPAVKYVEGCG